MKYTALCDACPYFDEEFKIPCCPDDDARESVGCPYLFGEKE